MDNYKSPPPYAVIPGKDHEYTQRSLFERYRDLDGACWVESDPPEQSVFSETGEITCMVLTKYVIGIPHNDVYVGPPPCFYENPEILLNFVLDWIMEAIHSRYLWCPPGCEIFRKHGEVWASKGVPMETNKGNVLSSVQDSNLLPLCISTIHSAMESSAAHNTEIFKGLYPHPRTTTPSAGLLGTSHNNSFIDISPFEKDRVPDKEERSWKDEYLGFICSTHTSHSYEAGKSRRVTVDVKVRLLGYRMHAVISRLLNRIKSEIDSETDWTLYCLGQFCSVSERTVNNFCAYHREVSFVADPEFGIYIKRDRKICIICVSSGVLSKKCSNGVWADSSNVHKSDRLASSVNPIIDRSGKDFHRACLSGHFLQVPFIEHNAPIRTSISSGQLLQAVCSPYCPATAAVSPIYIFDPIITTRTYKRVMMEQKNNFDLASYLPGENLCVLYLNLPLNYEDSMLISRRYVELGGFSTMSICKYIIQANDYVPPVGRMLCSKICQWWKAGCQKYCLHTKDFIENNKRISPFGCPTGRVKSRHLTKTGEQSVQVVSFETFQPGNKISTFHGQKGVVSELVNYEDMPICYTEDGDQITPDFIFAGSSIINRLTAGQIFESGASIARIQTPSNDMVILPDQEAPPCKRARVIDGKNGLYFTTVRGSLESPSLEGTEASLGYVRILNQSQMTRERHFTSHRSVHSNTLRTPVRRSKGGGVRDGEMEIQAMVAAGLSACSEELRKRGDEVVVLLCMSCQCLRQLHQCTEVTEFAEITIPYDLYLLAFVSKITDNVSLKFTVVPDQ